MKLPKLSIVKTVMVALLLVTNIASVDAQVKDYFGTTPDLKVSGKEFVDPNGRPVSLHGVMDTPNAYFNGARWAGTDAQGVKRHWTVDYSDKWVEPCLQYFKHVMSALANPAKGTYCNLFRLHLDPAWTNDPNKTATNGGDENDPSRFSADRLRTYMNSLYMPIMEEALGHGLYVIIRPPGVFPADVTVGDYYNQYLLTVWDIVSSNDIVKKNAGRVMLELGNEPVRMSGNLADYFQPIVNKIRQNGFTGILLLPGTSYQADYRNYKTKAIQDNNFAYAVHNYPGWYGGWDANQTQAQFISTFEAQVPIDEKPIVITEVDWSPMKAGAGHWNELHTQYTEGNFGTWGTGTTSGQTSGVSYQNTQNISWGSKFKALVDKHPNISWTLQGTTTYVDMDAYLRNGTVQPAFIDDMKAAGYPNADQACSGACFQWYYQYACGDRVPMPGTTAEKQGNVDYDPATQRYYFYTPYSAAFTFNDFDGMKLTECADFTIKLGNSSIGYRLDVQLKKADGTIIQMENPSNPGQMVEYIIGSEDKGTRFTTPQDIQFNIQEIYADYIREYPGCTIGLIRINTVVPYGDEDTQKTGKHYITINEMNMNKSQVTAAKNNGTSITTVPYNNYALLGNGTKSKDFASNAYAHNIGASATEVSGGTEIYGTSNVGYADFVDLSNYKSITFTGVSSSDTPVRFLFNRPAVYNAEGNKVDGTNKEISVAANSTIDLEELAAKNGGYVHLHAIKANWGQNLKLTSAVLTDKNGNKTDLTSLPFSQWDVKVEGEFSNEETNHKYNLNQNVAEGGVIAGYSTVDHNKYIDLSNYDRMVIEGTGGVVRFMFNRLVKDGPLTEIKSDLDANGGKIIINLKEIDNNEFVHLNGIKVEWGNTASVKSILLHNDTDVDQFADYYISGAGYLTSSVNTALNDDYATVIDLRGFNGKWDETFTTKNPNCLLVYREENKIGDRFDGRNLVKKSGDTYDTWSINLVDGYNFRSPVDVSTVGGASYTRELTTEWATATFPFEVKVEENQGVSFYTLNAVDSDKMEFTAVEEGTVLPANTPVLYRNKAKGETKITGNGIAKTISGFNIQPIDGVAGWYICQSMEGVVIADVTTDPVLKDYNVYGISGDQFIKATKKLTTKAFRAFFLQKKNTTGAANARFDIVISAEEEPDGIIDVDATHNDATESVRYNAAGQRVNAPAKGLNIIRMSDGTVRKRFVK